MVSRTQSGLETLSSFANEHTIRSEPWSSIAKRFSSAFTKSLKAATGSSFKCSALSATLGKYSLSEACCSEERVAKVFSLEGLDSRGVISLGTKLIYHALEFMLGAKECGTQVKKQITLIESSIAQKLLRLAIKDLDEAIEPSCQGVNLHLEQNAKEHKHSTVVKVTFLLSCDKYSEELILILPCENKAAALFGQNQDNWYYDLERANLRGEVELEARISDPRPRDLAEFFNLKVGDTILLGAPIEDGVELGTKEYVIARGKAGDLRGAIGVSISKLESN